MHSAIIKAARAGLDWTQARLASEAGLHPKTVAYWERATGEIPPQPESGAIARIKAALARRGALINGDTVWFPQPSDL